ncbi:hypothetical protein CDL12_25107 [Handroanthus impetiginosus]|uniref:Uncharacterized protein n=1 Tax=Handroanthus impetiginosus TaxID=429701 RepID=A0A2G9GAN9_9LAMI|nr:hypothetical protein CDL12_25107 [Handroanthus impetiginosus]
MRLWHHASIWYLGKVSENPHTNPLPSLIYPNAPFHSAQAHIFDWPRNRIDNLLHSFQSQFRDNLKTLHMTITMQKCIRHNH